MGAEACDMAEDKEALCVRCNGQRATSCGECRGAAAAGGRREIMKLGQDAEWRGYKTKRRKGIIIS